MSKKPLSILKKYWGYPSFRSNQEEIIAAVLAGDDVIAVLPTGAGKSLCYQIPGLCFDGLTLVISPLIALMKDQIKGLKDRNIKALGLFSGQSKREQDIILDNAVYDDVKFLFISPERIKSEIFQQRVLKMDVALVAIDEAHCISEWGHDFRPEYRRIATISKLVPDVSFLALTATATSDVVADIGTNLELEDPQEFIHSPIRKNLSYNVLNTEAKKEYLANYVSNATGGKIIYVNTRKNSKEIQRYLSSKGINCRAFHGGMDRKERESCIEDWNSNKVRVIIATKAFGMGIDKADVRLVLHLSPPQTIESYVQEAGRAGRDGAHAESIILYNKGDQKKLRKTIDDTYPDIAYLQEIYKQVCQHLKVATGPCQTEFYPFYVAEFSSKYNLSRFKAFNALKLLHQNEVIYLSDSILHPSRLRMHEHIIKNLLSNPKMSEKMAHFIKVVLRSYEGLFLDFTVIDEMSIAKKNNLKKSQIIAALEWLQKRGAVDYQRSYLGHTISFKEYRFPSDKIPINDTKYYKRKDALLKSISSMEEFLLTDDCRQIQIAQFFDFEETDCKLCDNCVAKYEVPNARTLGHQISELLSDAPMTLTELYSKFSIGYRSSIQEILTSMESENEVVLKSGRLTLT